MAEEQRVKVDNLLTQFDSAVESICTGRRLRGAVVRSRMPCSIVALLDKASLTVMAERSAGMPTSQFIGAPDFELPPQKALESARWDFGLQDPFVVIFPPELLDKTEADRKATVEAIALAHVASETQRAIAMTSLVPVNPLFGPAAYVIEDHLVFVLMPFEDSLTRIYTAIIKPTVESKGLVCRRADELRTNRVVIQDIWKAVCEARIIVADLTGANPNVMYELGIAHTVGKETILIYQRSTQAPRFPFDLAHIRRIEYDDSASGGKKLEKELADTIDGLLRPQSLS